MSEQVEPQWDLLPRDPEGFFGLSEGYDLRELKRSYNQFIRRFKPEKFPEEFQRIRAAYEALNAAVRFNLPTSSGLPAPAPLTWDESAPTYPGHRAKAEPSGPGRIRQAASPGAQPTYAKPPAELFSELRDKSGRTPDDYVALAFLADVVAMGTAPGTQPFIEWLLAGQTQYPRDMGLTALIREYLAQPLPIEELGILLRRIVRTIAPEYFQYATEGAWDRLLREGSFEQFGDCVRDCGAQLGKAMGHWQLVFYVHVLIPAAWKADDEFMNELWTAVEDHYHTVQTWVEDEYETVSMLLDYRAQREAFVARGPACGRIDQAIRDWCLLPETQSDARVLDCLYFLSQRGQRLLEEFPDPQERMREVLLLWERIATDVLKRQEEPPPLEPEAVARHSREFMIRVHRRNSRTRPFYQGLMLVVASIGIVVMAFVIAVSLLIRLCWKLIEGGQVLSALLDGVLSAIVLIGGFVAAAVAFVIGGRLRRVRYEAIRGELIKLLRVVPLAVDDLAVALAERENETFGEDNDDTINDTEVLARGLHKDPAMALFALAQLSLHTTMPEPVAEDLLVEVVEAVEERVVPPSRPVRRRLQ